MEFYRYLDAAVEEVKRALEGGGVAILVPPGSARGEVAKRLVEESVVSEDDVLLYEDLHRRLGIGRPFKRVGEQFYVGEQPLLDYLARGGMLKWALREKGRNCAKGHGGGPPHTQDSARKAGGGGEVV